MECRLRKRGDTWHAMFRYGTVRYNVSLESGDEVEAGVRIGPIRDAVYRIENGLLEVPPGVDVRAFIAAGGKEPTAAIKKPPTLAELASAYLEGKQDVEADSRATAKTHLDHVARLLGGALPVTRVALPDVENYARDRLKERHHGRLIRSYTVRKEIRTFRHAWEWAADRGLVSPPNWEVRSVKLPKDQGREPFRTYQEIQEVLMARLPVDLGAGTGKPAAGKKKKPRSGNKKSRARGMDPVWECLYLTSGELRALVDYAASADLEPWVPPMIAFVAMTGCRRSEMVRSRLSDWDLARGAVQIREKKRDTTKEFTTRRIGVHPHLARIIREWVKAKPRGPWMITKDGTQLTVDEATDHFKRALRDHEKWSMVRGFHTLRHSVASAMAAAGKDPRTIDEVLGHQTEEMRKRYQHLLPAAAQEAVSGLFEPLEGEGRDSDTGSAPRD